MADHAELIARQAWNCDEWPEWLHKVVAETNDVADRLDMSAEQAHAYAALSALRAQPAAVKVRALEWGNPDSNGEVHAGSIFGIYTIREPVLQGVWLTQVGGYHATYGAAKSAAQADYERRIRSAIVGGGDDPL